MALNLTMFIKAPKAAYLTLGCRVNQYETQCIREELEREGFMLGSIDEPCDVYVINTCAVTAESVRKGRQAIRRALRQKEQNPNAIVCVCGCYAQGSFKDGISLPQGIDVLAGNSRKNALAKEILRLYQKKSENRNPLDLREDIAIVRQYETLSLCRSHNARAFVKIEDGCNSFCSYCYVPLVRGRVRSRPLDEVKREVLALTENGYREVVLTGIETGAWGEDLEGTNSLCDLVEAIHSIPGLERIRFGSLKPSLFSDDFCQRLRDMSKVLPHFHLSLQSGSDSILQKMNRKYGRAEEEAAINSIYAAFPDAGLSADFICGFPGETEADFLDSVSLVRKAGLLHTHIFPFSPRAGTRAETMEQTVSEEEKKERCAYLLKEAKKSSLTFAEKRVGKQYHVLCERIKDGNMLGYTENFIYTKTPVPSSVQVGEIYSVRLTKDSGFSVETLTVLGEMLSKG